jgi:plastocyanin
MLFMTTRLATPFATLFIAVGLTGLAACGGGATTGGTVPADADVVVKAIDGVAWDQKSYEATPTDGNVTIYVENDSSIAHNMYVLDANDKVQGTYVELSTKGSHDTRVLPLAPGTYQIVCKVPGHNNMNASLTVK